MSIFFDFLIKSPSITELIKEIKVIDSFEYFDKLDNMWTIDLRENLNLV